MKKKEYNDDVDMRFAGDGDWHFAISLPSDAQVTEIHLRVYSFPFPEYIYKIHWSIMKLEDKKLKIPIMAKRKEHSDAAEAVRLAFDITYYSQED